MSKVVGAVAAILLAASAAQAQDCRLKQYASIPLEVDANALLLPAQFGDKPEKLVLRLDDAANGITADAVQALDLSTHSMPPNLHFHRDGQDVERVANARDISLGELKLERLEFLVVRSQRYGNGAIGDIGSHLFENMDYELDIAGGRLNLFSPDHCPGAAVYWTKTGFTQLPLKSSPEISYLRAPMTLDNTPVVVGFSTLGQSSIGMNAMRRLFGIDQTSPALVPAGQDLLGRKRYRYAFKTLTAGGLTITNPAINVYDEEERPECKEALHFAPPEDTSPMHMMDRPRLARCFGGQDVVLGLSVLRKLHMYVSNKEKLLYLTGADAH